MNKPFKVDPVYDVIMHPWTLATAGLSFRNIYTRGTENLKAGKPYILAANHQNTFMDGIIIIRSRWQNRSFILVRADIFKSPIARFFLNVIRLMPIYRKRDGISSVQQNEEIFEKCFRIFDRNKTLIIFPEGNHAMPRHLRPLQKGISRIAFGYKERNHFQDNLMIVPIGIHYTDHAERNSDVVVNYGKPIELNDYREMLEENPNKAMNELKRELDFRMRHLMIDIKSKDQYKEWEALRALMAQERSGLDLPEQIMQQSECIRQLENYLQDHQEEENQFKAILSDWYQTLQKHQVQSGALFHSQDWNLMWKRPLKMLVVSPFAWAGKMLNLLPKWVLREKVIPNFKDPAWHAAIRLATSLVLYPVYYLILTTVVGLLSNWILAGMFLFALPLLGMAEDEWDFQLHALRRARKAKKFKRSSAYLEFDKLTNQLKGFLKKSKEMQQEEAVLS